jgi:hypothetical protein
MIGILFVYLVEHLNDLSNYYSLIDACDISSTGTEF